MHFNLVSTQILWFQTEQQGQIEFAAVFKMSEGTTAGLNLNYPEGYVPTD